MIAASLRFSNHDTAARAAQYIKTLKRKDQRVTAGFRDNKFDPGSA
jgi:hypothetical protein